MRKNRMSIRIFTKMNIPKNPVLKKKNFAVLIAVLPSIVLIPNVNIAEADYNPPLCKGSCHTAGVTEGLYPVP